MSLDLMRIKNLEEIAGSKSIPANMLKNFISENTIKSYLTDIKQFFGVKSETDITISMVQNVTIQDVNEYCVDLHRKGRKNSTINRKLEALSSFYRYLSRKDVNVVEYNPFSVKSGAIRFKVPDYAQARVLTTQEIKNMIKTCDNKEDLIQFRNRLILLILATTGIRRAELVDICLGDLTITDNHYTIIIRKGKGNKTRIVEIPGDLFNDIKEFMILNKIPLTDLEHPIFFSLSSNADKRKKIHKSSINRIIRQIASESGIDIENVSSHSFRQTYITRSREMGISLEDISKRVGHEYITTTQRYDHARCILKDNPANTMYNELID